MAIFALTTLHCIMLRLCGVRYAVGMICSLVLTLQSNPFPSLRCGKGFSSLSELNGGRSLKEKRMPFAQLEPKWRTERDSNPR